MLPLPLKKDGHHGCVVRYLGTDGFKLAMIVGDDGTQVRCRLWRAATKQWTTSTKLVSTAELRALSTTEKHEYRARIANAIEAAHNDLGIRARP